MKILVMCPGSWTHELNSPERGEGRWAQNYAQMLALAGHDVFAASGRGNLQPGQVDYGVKLVNQDTCGIYGPFDIYIDAAWWDRKEPKAKAKKYIALKWSLENYLRDNTFPDDFYLAYPYPSHHHLFSKFHSSHKTFALPTMFGTEPLKPNWEATKIFLPGKIESDRDPKAYISAISAILKKYPVEGGSKPSFEKIFGSEVDFNRKDSYWFEALPYNQILEAISRSRISMPILNPGCIIETAIHGVPSVFWEHGGFYNSFGKLLDISIPHDAPPERLIEVVEQLMNNKKKHAEAVLGLQNYFSCHIYAEAIKYFNLMVETIF